MKTQPTQAVILAGGLGTRMRPFTDTAPKPMFPIQDSPFIDHLLDMLEEQGFKSVVILLGYLAEQVVEHCGDGARWGISIEYSIAPAETETGERLRLASARIDSQFLLLYCDNYWPLQMERYWETYQQSPTLGMLTAYNNRDRYTRDNLIIGDDGVIVTYDKKREAQGLQGVDIGYALFQREVLEMIPEGNVSFEATVYPQLVERGELRAYQTDHRYYSIGSPNRLPLTEQFLSDQKVIILDRDGVFNEKPPRAEYVTKWDEFRWIPGTIKALSLLQQAGYKIILVSNQAGIARGAMTDADLAAIHDEMQRELAQHQVEIAQIYHCPHGWDEGCFCRKPSPGMLFQAQRDHHFDLTKTYFVGDDERDQEAGEAAGCLTALVSPEYPLLKFVENFINENS